MHGLINMRHKLKATQDVCLALHVISLHRRRKGLKNHLFQLI